MSILGLSFHERHRAGTTVRSEGRLLNVTLVYGNARVHGIRVSAED